MLADKNILDIYGEEFQLSIIRVIITDPSFFRSVREHLLPEYFTFEYAKIPYKLIISYFEKYGHVPTFETVKHLLRGELYNKEIELEICLTEIFKLEHEASKDSKFVKDEIISFCKMQESVRIYDKYTSIVDDYRSNPTIKPDFEPIYERWKKILSIDSDVVNSDIMANFREYYKEQNKRNCITTGYEMLDFLFDGGMAGGEIHCFAAYLGRGKTTLCINIGAHAFKMGKKVLHFTFENPHDYMARAYHSRISGIPIRNIRQLQDKVELELKNYSGGFHVKQYPMKRHTAKIIESYYYQLVDTGFDADLIIIDSPLHLKPSEKRTNEMDSLSLIWKDIKALATELDKPFLVTAQLNRASAQVAEADTDTVGNSIDIARDSDSFISINRTKEDIIADKGKLFCGKNRFGPDQIGWTMLWSGGTRAILEDRDDVQQKIERLKPTVEYLSMS